MHPCSLVLALLPTLLACASAEPEPAPKTTPAADAPAVRAVPRGPVAAPQDAAAPHAGMLRYPDLSATHVVFVYADDLWLVPREGGVATPLASPPGYEGWPRFSSDGGTIAFVGNYDGNRDIYTVPVSGGVPTRVTHHPAGEVLAGWTPEGRLLFGTNGLAGRDRQ